VTGCQSTGPGVALLAWRGASYSNASTTTVWLLARGGFGTKTTFHLCLLLLSRTLDGFSAQRNDSDAPRHGRRAGASCPPRLLPRLQTRNPLSRHLPTLPPFAPCFILPPTAYPPGCLSPLLPYCLASTNNAATRRNMSKTLRDANRATPYQHLPRSTLATRSARAGVATVTQTDGSLWGLTGAFTCGSAFLSRQAFSVGVDAWRAWLVHVYS